MKHLLNDLTEQEKNSIREQHTGGMNVVTENFSKLINAKSGSVKSFLKEESDFEMEASFADDTNSMVPSIMRMLKPIYKEYGSEGVVTFLTDIIGTINDIGDEAFMGPDEVNEQGEEDFLDREFKDRAIKNVVQGEPYNSLRKGSYSDCEGLIQTMKFISNDYMESIETSPDEIDEAEAEDIYDQFETELGGILDHANQMDCDEEIINHLEILYNEYLSDMANKLGLR
jgi:hypothetical protein